MSIHLEHANPCSQLHLRYSLLLWIYICRKEECLEGWKWISAEDWSKYLLVTGGRMTLPGSLVGMVRICPEMSLNTGCASGKWSRLLVNLYVSVCSVSLLVPFER